MYCVYVFDIIYADISDHLPVCIVTDMEVATTNKPEIILKRLMNEVDLFSIQNTVSNYNFD